MLHVGAILYGFCGGAFGRDSYQNKRVEGIGVDWVVARETDSGAIVFTRSTPESLFCYTNPSCAT